MVRYCTDLIIFGTCEEKMFFTDRAKGLDHSKTYDNMTAATCDGASNMMGCKTGLVTCLQECYPEVEEIASKETEIDKYCLCQSLGLVPFRILSVRTNFCQSEITFKNNIFLNQNEISKHRRVPDLMTDTSNICSRTQLKSVSSRVGIYACVKRYTLATIWFTFI
jgi:hypothetical protein